MPRGDKSSYTGKQKLWPLISKRAMNPRGWDQRSEKMPGPQLIKAATAAKNRFWTGEKESHASSRKAIEESVAEPRRLVSESTK